MRFTAHFSRTIRTTTERAALALVLVLAVGTVAWALPQAASTPAAQTPPKQDPPAPAPDKDKEKQDKEKKDAQKTPTPTPTPAAEAKPAEWGPFTVRSAFEVGYRWKSGSGSEDMYRSQINLGQGPKLLSGSLVMDGAPHSGKLWDRLSLNVDNWGGDPYNTVRLRAEKSDVYLLDFSYQNIQYYNSIPTFSNPLLSGGSLISQHQRDTGRHLIETRLTLWPTALIHPYFGFSRSRLLGVGRSTYYTEGDDFVLHTDIRESSDEYRVGVEFGRTRFGGFVEQAFRHYKEDWRVTQIDSLSQGNNPNPVLGVPIFLTNFLRNDQVRGDAPLTRAFLRWAPLDALQMSGYASYINSERSFDEDQTLNGSLLSFADRRTYPSRSDLTQSDAQMPGLMAGGSVAFRPSSKFSLVDSYNVYAFHSDGSGSASRTLFGSLPLSGAQTPTDVTFIEPLDSRISFDTRRNTIDGAVQVLPILTLRLGYRYQTQEATITPKESPQGFRPTDVRSKQHTPLAGIDLRVSRAWQLSAEFEKGYTDNVFYRTMPKNYTRVRVRTRAQLTKMLRVSGYANVFDHRNGVDGIDLTGHNKGYGASVSFTPTERTSFTLDYQRSDLDSNIQTIIPQTLSPSRSLYIENGNYGGAHFDLGLPRGAALTLGYSVTGTTGNFPINFHQPYASISIPVSKRVSWNSSWRYYGYNEKGASLEDYRTHLYTSGLAFHY